MPVLKDKRIFVQKEPTICTESSETDCSPMKRQEKPPQYRGHVEISSHLSIQRKIQGIRIQVCFLQPVHDRGFLLEHIIFRIWANDSSSLLQWIYWS